MHKTYAKLITSHLISRYWAVTNVDYIHTRNERRIFTMIVLVWSVALIVSLAPQFGWKDPDYLDRITLQQRCLVSQDVSYQIFATCSTFYVPLLVILVLYWKIFQTARKRIHRRREHQGDNAKKDCEKVEAGTEINCDKHSAVKKRFLNLKRYGKRGRTTRKAETLAASLLLTEGQSTTTVDTVDDLNETQPRHEHKTTAFTISEKVSTANLTSGHHAHNAIQIESSTNVSPEKSSTATTTNNGSTSHQSHMSDISRIEILSRAGGAGAPPACERSAPISCEQQQPAVTPARDKKESLEAKRERKAAKTLAIITGAFVVCWLPFFIMALVMPICDGCVINDYMASFFLWLGYFNSTLNPVIYTIFSPDFRQAFARILFGRHRRRRQKKY